MIKSMTGYGRAVETRNGREISVEIRSVNNRYLDCNIKLPRLYSFAEEAVKQAVKSSITRGKVDVFLSIANCGTSAVEISLNRPVLEGYLAAMRTIVTDYGVTDDISVSSLAKLPDLFLVEKADTDEEQVTEDLIAVVREALSAFDAMRTREGAALEADLRSRAGTILTLTERVEARSPVTLAEYRARLTAKMQEVLDNQNIDESRILAEAALYADKIAVDEETVRLRSHLSQLDNMLTGGGAIGRKLDFLLQEMNREANTIGSKGNDLEQARTVVEIKAELEKIREQTQNIE
ncbi:YicC/YloC family endoribonuclease [Candidatus Avoscillospira sp. LCP25S3_F1]|uniref:YicC/YloC family endoribonuclease n=1 Tax=Candidatus Avoscillospira sp. LCP25S3_F1 TaxID=3438825 RepID=UPI003F8EA74A